MAVRLTVSFTVLWMSLATLVSTQSASRARRPNTGFIFPSTNTNSQQCRTADGSTGSCVKARECGEVDFQGGNVPSLCYWEDNEPVVCCVNRNTVGTLSQPEAVCGKRERSAASRQPVIAGGWISQPSAWPWVVAILTSNLRVEKFLCGGTMVSTKYILTAAHCFRRNGVDQNRIPVARFIIRVGSNENDQGQAHRIKKIMIHEQYRVGQHYNDIAIIEVNEPIVLSFFVRTICLPSSELQGRRMVGHEVVVVGWGDQSFGGIRDNKLREVNISVLDREQCNNAYSTLASRSIPKGVTSQFICAGDPEGGKDACQADSGGPLMMPSSSEWTIVGIVSFGYGCAQRGFPGVYTKVSAYLNWIRDKTDL
uniref:Venom toxin n=1 Tax=Hemiscorpius lepturus TaxID=520031 RepID=A0A1L4BJ77_HEMLE|nr:venom toxin [Hemiscorpius lepturus]